MCRSMSAWTKPKTEKKKKDKSKEKKNFKEKETHGYLLNNESKEN